MFRLSSARGRSCFWDPRYETVLNQTGIVNGLVNNRLGQADAKVVVPGDWTRSILFKRISVAGQPHSMPPLAKQRVDNVGIGLIAEWIASLDVEVDSALPAEWKLAPIGEHSAPPTTRWHKGSFFLQAQCHDLRQTKDDALFVHGAPGENGQITARVVSLTLTDAWTKAGVMVRQSDAADAPHAIMVVTPGQGSAFQHRHAAGLATHHQSGPAVTAPFWVRLAWHRGEVVASTSADGKTWQETGRALVAFTGPILSGLCLSGHQAQETAVASFDQVRIEVFPSP